jgi:hypothetical protein
MTLVMNVKSAFIALFDETVARRYIISGNMNINLSTLATKIASDIHGFGGLHATQYLGQFQQTLPLFGCILVDM